MTNFEKLGVFYLGRTVDTDSTSSEATPLLYDSQDLTTHAVCIGMTGSGKTGLGIGLIEEAAIDGIPSILIDPKGDLGNLLLTFPNLSPADFRPWVDEGEAARKQMTPDEFATHTAAVWKSWPVGQDGERSPASRRRRILPFIHPLQGRAAAFHSPASMRRRRVLPTTPRPCATACPPPSPACSHLSGWRRVLQSREHILLSFIVDENGAPGAIWALTSLVHAIQEPGVGPPGVLALESFSAKDRLALAMRLNNLIASPDLPPGRRASRSIFSACSIRRKANRACPFCPFRTSTMPNACSLSRCC